MASLDDLKNDMAESLYGISLQEALQLGICLNCKEKALPKCYSAVGRREYHISGLCEECFDNLFKEDQHD